MGLHHRVGEKQLPLDGADRENREAAAVREFAEPVGEVAFPLPAQPRHPMRGDLVEKAFRNSEAPEVLEAVQQPVGVGGIVARLELPEPDEPRHAGVDRLFEQMLEVAPKPGRHPLGDAGFDPAFRGDQRVGAEPLDRRRRRQDGSRVTAGLDEPVGIDAVNVYHDFASGVRDDRPGLDSCLRALRKGDVLVVWKLDRLGRNLAHLVNTVQDLSARSVGLRVLAGQGAQIDTTTAAGRLVFGIFAALAEFERELIRERTRAGLKAARARGRKGGRKFALSKAQVRRVQAAMAHRDTSVVRAVP